MKSPIVVRYNFQAQLEEMMNQSIESGTDAPIVRMDPICRAISYEPDDQWHMDKVEKQAVEAAARKISDDWKRNQVEAKKRKAELAKLRAERKLQRERRERDKRRMRWEREQAVNAAAETARALRRQWYKTLAEVGADPQGHYLTDPGEADHWIVDPELVALSSTSLCSVGNLKVCGDCAHFRVHPSHVDMSVVMGGCGAEGLVDSFGRPVFRVARFARSDKGACGRDGKLWKAK